MRTFLFVFLSLHGWFYQKKESVSVLKLKSVAEMFKVMPGYAVQKDIDSVVTYNKKEYLVNTIETFTPNSEPATIKERHDLGFLEWTPKEFAMIIKDTPEDFISSGVITINGKTLNFGNVKFQVIYKNPKRNFLMCLYHKTIYLIYYYN